MDQTRRAVLATASALMGGAVLSSRPAQAASGRQISADSVRALHLLYASQVKARDLAGRATAILVFPKIIKAGLLVGGQGGDGALLVGGKTEAYYNIFAASFGLQAGAQTFSYALFFMNAASLEYLRNSDGWAVGTGPSVVVVDKGMAASMTSTTVTQDVYAFAFGQRGLMAGIGIEGSKITHMNPGP
jgi:lipid-binding SYLF domain-containing protein